MFKLKFNFYELQCEFVGLAPIRAHVGLQSCLRRNDFPWTKIAFTEQAIMGRIYEVDGKYVYYLLLDIAVNPD